MPDAIEIVELDLVGRPAWGLASDAWPALVPGDWSLAPMLTGLPSLTVPRHHLTWNGWAAAIGLPLPGHISRTDNSWTTFDREDAECLRDLILAGRGVA